MLIICLLLHPVIRLMLLLIYFLFVKLYPVQPIFLFLALLPLLTLSLYPLLSHILLVTFSLRSLIPITFLVLFHSLSVLLLLHLPLFLLIAFGYMTQLICHLLTNFFHLYTPWSSILSSSDVNFAWLTFNFTSPKIIHLMIPSKLVCAPPHPPWITHSFLSCIKRRNFHFKRAKSSNSPLHWSSYRSFRNETLSYIRSLKVNFFRHLSSSPTSRRFWSSVKRLRKKSSAILPLFHSGNVDSSDSSKAHLLNDFITSCFNSSHLTDTTLNSCSPLPPCPSDLLCTQNEILQLLLHLPSDTATGPDGISSRMLKSTAHSIVIPLLHIFPIGNILT